MSSEVSILSTRMRRGHHLYFCLVRIMDNNIMSSVIGHRSVIGGTLPVHTIKFSQKLRFSDARAKIIHTLSPILAFLDHKLFI